MGAIKQTGRFCPSGARRAGFSLVELLVVIGVIAVLIAILMPVLNRARRAGNRIVCMNNLRQLGIGSTIYANTFGGLLPWDGYGEGDRPVRPVGFWDDPALWVNAATKYAGVRPYSQQQDDDTAGRIALPRGGDKGMLICPEAMWPSPGPTGDTVANGYYMMWGWDPAGAPAQNPVQRKTFWCYGFNTQLDGGVEDRNVGYRVTVKITSIAAPSNTALIVEKIMSPLETVPSFATSVAQSEVSWKEFTTRHDGGGFVLFVDGHVGYAARADVVSPPGAPFDYNLPAKVVWNPFGAAN